MAKAAKTAKKEEAQSGKKYQYSVLIAFQDHPEHVAPGEKAENHHVGDDVSHFDVIRLKSLVSRGLVSQEELEEEDPEMIDHIVTADDLVKNPDWAAEGIKEGQTIQVPKL